MIHSKQVKFILNSARIFLFLLAFVFLFIPFSKIDRTRLCYGNSYAPSILTSEDSYGSATFFDYIPHEGLCVIWLILIGIAFLGGSILMIIGLSSYKRLQIIGDILLLAISIALIVLSIIILLNANCFIVVENGQKAYYQGVPVWKQYSALYQISLLPSILSISMGTSTTLATIILGMIDLRLEKRKRNSTPTDELITQDFQNEN